MAKTLTGLVAFASFERDDVYNYTNPADGKSKLLRSLKVLLAHGDGTVTRESLSIPDNYPHSTNLTPGQAYGFPVVSSVSKKTNKQQYALRQDVKPFPAPQIE